MMLILWRFSVFFSGYIPDFADFYRFSLVLYRLIPVLACFYRFLPGFFVFFYRFTPVFPGLRWFLTGFWRLMPVVIVFHFILEPLKRFIFWNTTRGTISKRTKAPIASCCILLLFRLNQQWRTSAPSSFQAPTTSSKNCISRTSAARRWSFRLKTSTSIRLCSRRRETSSRLTCEAWWRMSSTPRPGHLI